MGKFNSLLRKNLKENLLLLFLITYVFFVSFYKLNEFPKDFDAEAVNEPGNGLIILSQAKEKSISAEEAIEKAYQEWKRPISPQGRYLEVMAFSLPLSGSLFYIFWKLTNSPFSSIVYLNIFVGFLITLVTYLFARAMYGRNVAFWATLIFSGSLFFLIFTRTGKIYFGLTTLLSVSLLYSFFLAYKSKSLRFLILTAIVAAFLWFNGWSPIFLLPLILFVFVLWSRKRTSFSKRQYLKAVIITFGVFSILSLSYTLFFNASAHQVLYWMHRHWLFARGNAEGFASLSERIINFKVFWQTIFWGITWEENTSLSHLYQLIPGKPFIPPFISFFSVVGFAVLIRRRNLADQLCLVTLALPFLVFSSLTKFQPRYLFFVAPIIYIITAVGIQKSFELLPRFFAKKTVTYSLKLIILVGMVLTFYSASKDYFGFYIKNDGLIMRFHGQREAAEFIMKNGSPQNSQVVLGDETLVPYDNFFFYTQGRSYAVKYWTQFGFLQGGQVATAEEVEKWEEEILEKKEKIFYVFSSGPHFYKMPGPIVWYPAGGRNAFEELHPALAPSEVIYYSSGTPALIIYQVTRDTPRYQRFNYLGLKSNRGLRSLDQKIMAFQSRGKIPDFLGFLPQTTIQKTILLNYGPNSLIRFYPEYKTKDRMNDFYSATNLEIAEANEIFFWSLDQENEGVLVYKVSLLTKIDEVTIQTNPRIFNDKRGKNIFAIDYSLDDRDYKNLLTISSIKNGEWTSRDSKQTYHRIKIESPTFYLKLIFRGEKGEVQLWPNPVLPLLEINFDSSEFPKMTLDEFAKSPNLPINSNDKLILHTNK